MTNPTPTDPMKDIEASLATMVDEPSHAARLLLASALLAAIRKLVSSTLPAHAQPSLAYIEVTHISINHGLTADAYKLPPGIYRLYASPTIPQAGLIEAADKHADDYEGQDIPARDVRAAITNAFYAGARFRSLPQEEAAAQMQQWQPIETAPKDGTPFLAWYPKHRLDDDGDSTDEVIGGDQAIVTCKHGVWDEPQWLDAVGAYYFDDWCFAEVPTLWQPLPPPPLHRSEQSTDKEQG